jgi:hypothetical protein
VRCCHWLCHTVSLSLRGMHRMREDVGPIMKLLRGPPWWGVGRCLLLQDIGVTGQAFQYDPLGRNLHRPASRLQPLHGRYTQ